MNMLNSYRILTGRRSFVLMIVYALVPTVLNILYGMIGVFVKNDAVRDFFTGFVSSFAGICLEIAAMISVCCVFNTNSGLMPGYRFFHSLKGGAERFRRGLIFANGFSLAAAALYIISGMLFHPQKEYIVLVAVMVLFALGWVDLFGAMGKIFLSMVPLFVQGLLCGFMAGIYEDEEQIGIYPPVLIVSAAVMVIFYITSAVYIIRNAKKIWEKEM